MISKAQITAILKDLGLGFVKGQQRGYDSKDVVLEPRFKGIRGGSVGPLTVTDAHMNVSERTQDKVRDAFKALPGVRIVNTGNYYNSQRLQGMRIEIPISEKAVRVLSFHWEMINTYVAAARMDPEYKSYWYIMSAEDQKI